jgi:actin related protein 2/3 complex subunit 2
MILLGIGHPMLKEQVLLRSGPECAEYRERNPLEMMIADFDDVTYSIKAVDDNFTLFFSMLGYEQIKGNGVEAYLAKVYAGDGVVFNFITETVGNLTYDFSLTCDVAADRGGKEGTEAFAGRISAIKRHVLASCFFYYFESVSANAAAVQAMKIPYRHNEAIWLKKGKEDQVVVIFSVTFADKNDWVVAEVFLREFADVRRDPALQTSPAASFSKNVPGELEGSGEEKMDNKVYISFVLFQKHWQGPLAEGSVSALCLFRNYLHYHIKASKAFMHMRMRKRADDLLQVLNRAKPPAEGNVDKKTWQGKTVHAQ